MKKTEIMTAVSSSLSKASFQLKKHSPEILIVAGVVGTVASAIMACKATTKISEIMGSTKENVDAIHDCMADGSLAEKYTPEDAKKDLAVVYVQTGVKLVKLYGPAVALGVLSLGSILASNNLLRQRNVALAAAYATVDKGFKEYRSRVIERFGDEVDRELKYNIKAKKFEETVVDENGKEKKVKTTVNIADPNAHSAYSCFFDESSENYEKNPEYNHMFLRSQQSYANDLLKVKGRLFLNDVYDMLGIPRIKAGQIVGWTYDTEKPTGDNFVDFGIYETQREKVRDSVEGYERVILLDFNVDGNIFELM